MATILTRESTDPKTYCQAVWGRVFNARRATDRIPRAVVQATDTAHVAEAVRYAAARKCRVSVRSGGHSYAVWSVRHDAVLLDLSGLRQAMGYDDETRVVAVSPGYTGEEVNAFLETRGRMFCGGHYPDVAMGGFLLQGGMGFNAKNWGWACESIVGIDVVTADGKEIYCSTAENPDLFWAARGAGPGFPAVVTRFHILTRPLAKRVYNCVYVYPKSSFGAVLQWVIDISPTADRDTEIVCVSKRVSEEDDDVEIIAAFLTFKDGRQSAEEAMQSVHDSRPLGSKMSLFCGEASLAGEYARQRREQPRGLRYCSDNAYISNDEPDVPGVLERAFTRLPTAKSVALYLSLNPTSRRPLDDMALSLQSDHYFAVYTIWDDESGDAENMGWVRGIMREVERHSAGSYLGDADFQISSDTHNRPITTGLFAPYPRGKLEYNNIVSSAFVF